MPTKARQPNDTEKAALPRRGSQHTSPEARRSQLLGAAARCFAARGYRATTMAMIAQQSDLSIGTLYRFFESKDDILMAMLDMRETQLNRCWFNREAGDGPLCQLREFGQAAVDQIAAEHGSALMWQEFFRHEMTCDRARELHASLREQLVTSVTEGVLNGTIKAVSPTQVVDVFLAMFEGLLVQAAVEPGVDPGRRLAAAWSLIETWFQGDPRAKHMRSGRQTTR